jgi:hypothetical protein
MTTTRAAAFSILRLAMPSAGCPGDEATTEPTTAVTAAIVAMPALPARSGMCPCSLGNAKLHPAAVADWPPY